MKFIIEHMESEISPWVAIEYEHMIDWVGSGNLILTSLDDSAMDQLTLKIKHGAMCLQENILAVADIDASKVVLLDPSAKLPLSPCDGQAFEYFLFGGILGDHPPRDRTGELRKLGFATRHLGPVQLPTDQAVIFASHIVDKGLLLEEVPYIDSPLIKISKRETVEIPMRFLRKGDDAVIAPGLKELLKMQNDEEF